MHLNADAFNDLVILRSGKSAPSAVVTQAMMTFTVTTTADNGDNINPTAGSLRKAIIQANANPGLTQLTSPSRYSRRTPSFPKPPADNTESGELDGTIISRISQALL